VEGYRSLRREAIKALALTRHPAVVNPQDKALQSRTAVVLLRVLMKDGFAPEPRLDERAEAAIGVGYLQGKLYESYQPDYAAHYVGWFLVDLANQYQEEKQDQKRRFPYRHLAARLSEALTGPLGMQPDLIAWKKKQDPAVVKYVGNVLSKGADLL